MESKQEPIPIVSLPLPRLMEFSKEIESRCEQLADAIGQLQGAMARYDDIRMGRGGVGLVERKKVEGRRKKKKKKHTRRGTHWHALQPWIPWSHPIKEKR